MISSPENIGLRTDYSRKMSVLWNRVLGSLSIIAIRELRIYLPERYMYEAAFVKHANGVL